MGRLKSVLDYFAAGEASVVLVAGTLVENRSRGGGVSRSISDFIVVAGAWREHNDLCTISQVVCSSSALSRGIATWEETIVLHVAARCV